MVLVGLLPLRSIILVVAAGAVGQALGFPVLGTALDLGGAALEAGLGFVVDLVKDRLSPW